MKTDTYEIQTLQGPRCLGYFHLETELKMVKGLVARQLGGGFEGFFVFFFTPKIEETIQLD